jgi:phenylalanyl-tRNA synthetase beta chain
MSLAVLRRFTDVPGTGADVRRLLDELGVEVKRVERRADDDVFTLELLANRGDHHCYEGVAREIAARTGGALRWPVTADLTVGASPWPLAVDTPLCLVYAATLLERGAGPDRVDDEALAVLDAQGSRPLGAAVDATNVANLELGQPTHAFDADAIDGTLTIRESRHGETAWLLFTPAPVELPPGTVVIADDRKILAVAGVIGCEESKTTSSTRRLLLESATFDPVAVRKAARALRVVTDSATRFERGADPARPVPGAARVVALLEATGAFRRVGSTGVAGLWRDPGRVIELDAGEVDRFLHTTLGAEQIATILARHGYTVARDRTDVSRLRATVPPWRLWEVFLQADLVEDVLRTVGYDAVPTALPVVGAGALPSTAEIRRMQADEVLVAQGFHEVFTDGFYGRQVLDLLGLDEGHPLFPHVHTTNALDRAYALLKNNALHQAIDAVAANERRRVPDVALYEWTRTFHPLPHPAGSPDPTAPPCTEHKILWAVMAGRDRPKAWEDRSRPADVWFAKGVLTELGLALGLDLRVDAGDTSHPLAGLLHPGRRAAILLDGHRVGVFGEVHPAVCRRYKLRTARPVYLELAAHVLLETNPRRGSATEPSDLQPIVRSVALAVPAGIEAGTLRDALAGASPPWLEALDVVDLFPLPDGARSVTVELSYANLDGGRSAEEVNEAVERAMRTLMDTWATRGVERR